MKTFELKKLIPHLSAVVLFVLISLIYLSPILEGKKIDQQDIRQFTGMSKEIVDHRLEYDEEPLWTNSMFSGMPAYQISVRYKRILYRIVLNYSNCICLALQVLFFYTF